jgi:riboflavin kinase / FMN adenylyltransferase
VQQIQLIRKAGELRTGGRKVSVGIGMFDGVHLGHQQVLKQTIFDARYHKGISLAVTFDRHPNSVVAPARAPKLIYSLPQKLRAIESIGVDAILLIEFDQAFSRTPGEQFVRDLASQLGQIYSICVGNSFTFGHKRSGNVDLLKTIGSEVGFQVHGLAAVSLAGQIVSSTRIRERIAAGQLDAASQMLGRTYSISAKVLEGDKLGRQLGAPTANLDIRGLVTPPTGVYAVQAFVGEEIFPAVANLGTRPTVDKGDELRLEVHLLDAERNLYGQTLEICFVDFLRPEQRFSSLDHLKAQIARDLEAARKSFE